MTTEELRRELDRIGDSAPVVDVPGDTWRRARGSVLRDRVGMVAAASIVTAVVAGGITWLPDRGTAPVADSSEEGVPDSIGITSEVESTSDLAVGRASAVFLADGDAVVVDADDGTYRRLELPGLHADGVGVVGLTVSPDGRRLAYKWSVDDSMTASRGVRIVDLDSGEVDSYDLEGVDGGVVFVYSIAWSPGSLWLVWDGIAKDSEQNGAVAGRIGPDGSSTRVPRTEDESTTFAVGDNGDVLIATADELVRWNGRVRERQPRAGDWYPSGVVHPQGVRVETRATDDAADYVTSYRLADGEPIEEWEGDLMKPLGWLDTDTLVASVGNDTEHHLDLLDVTTGAVSEVGELHDSAQVSLATDLMTVDQPTVSRPVGGDADDPFDGTLLVGLGVAAAIALLVGLRYLRARKAS